MGSRPGSPFGQEDKAAWMFNLGGFTDSPHPHKQQTRCLYTIQATSFFPSLVATSLLFKKMLCQREIFVKLGNVTGLNYFT